MNVPARRFPRVTAAVPGYHQAMAAADGGHFRERAGAASVIGALDGVVGALLTGWAVATGRATPCAVVVADADGTVVARGTATVARPELAHQGVAHPVQGRTTVGFRIPLPDLPGGTLRVFADGVELPGSPISVGREVFDGAIALIDGAIEGWVHARALPGAPPAISLHDQSGVCLGTCRAVPAVAETGAADLADLFRPARFRIPLPSFAWGNGILHVRAEADGVVFAAASIELTLRGWVDTIGPDQYCGWLFSPEAPDRHFELELVCDGVVAATGRAILPRDDLRALAGPGWECGFALDLPRRQAEGAGMVIGLRLAGTDIYPFGGPEFVGVKRDLLGPLRRAAAAARRTGLDALESAALHGAVSAYAAVCRADPKALARLSLVPPQIGARRLTVIIPVYRDVAVTRACIESVLAHRDPVADSVLLINDASPEPGMAALLARAEAEPNVFVLTNGDNLGFVRAVNRGLAFARQGDVLLLNSDTRIFPGGIDELYRVAHAAPGVGTVTPLSNNATIFSYPVPDQGSPELDDVDFPTLAALVLALNRGRTIDVPTGHGFCMLITRAALDEVGGFDPAFGRGYGEENDFCRRAADRGLRNLAASGVYVEHRESVSFSAEKAALLSANLALLEARYPEYAAEVRQSFRRDDLRAARWSIDEARLARAAAAGARFVLVIRNWLGGGTQQAIADIELRRGYGGAETLDLCVEPDGSMRLRCGAPRLVAVFAPGEHARLFALLEQAGVGAVMLHQALGYTAGFIEAARAFGAGHALSVFLHDYYALCPRVTMIDATGAFCDAPDAGRCARCVGLDGAHEASRLTELAPAAHRELMHALLRTARHVVAPSACAAAYFRRVFAGVPIVVEPHPEKRDAYCVAPRAGDPRHIVLLGAIGPHKGAGTLLRVARRAQLMAPDLRFHVIGHTSCDEALRAVGNVRITGNYRPHELPGLVAASDAVLALFLHGWPETFSYTLSEAVQAGLVPVVPDIGAPAERVRAAGYGHVFGFPIDPDQVVSLLSDLAAGVRPLLAEGAAPTGFASAA
jgi:GT2 family glycosyltransferase/glycosyltransferase involved in cell wall biosynthesis